MSNQPSTVLSTLAPDLVAVFYGARPHPDIVIPRPLVTVAGLAAAARAARAAARDAGAGDPEAVTFEWDGPGQRLKN